MVNHVHFNWLLANEHWLALAALAWAVWGYRVVAGRPRVCDLLWRTDARALACLGLAAFGLCFSVAQLKGWPLPDVNDEFSFLLGADTFLQGRLTNPVPPLWEHFETLQVLLQPSYASKYPPGQAMFLALGKLLTTDPICGVWLNYALLSMACYWAARGHVSRRCAFTAASLFSLRILLHGYWTHSYWGGCPAALGGVLVTGAAWRWRRRPRMRDGVLLGLGLALLANTRPLEGMVATAPWVGLVLWRSLALGSMKTAVREEALRSRRLALLPSAGIMLLLLGWLAAYNNAVTGNWREAPYQAHMRQYVATPVFVWQSPPERPTYRHQRLEQIQTGWEYTEWFRQQSLAGWSQASAHRVGVNLRFYSGWLLAWPFVMSVLAWRRLEFCVAVSSLMLAVGCITSISWNMPHYSAPFAGAVLCLLAYGLKSLRRNPFPFAQAGAGAGAGAQAIQGLWWAGLFLLLYFMYPVPRHVLAARTAYQRQTIVDHLLSQGGKHLILVRYAPSPRPLGEWVFNGAEIERAPVVWAREMTPEADRRLIEHYHDRQVWLLEYDRLPREVKPHPLAVSTEDSPPLAE